MNLKIQSKDRELVSFEQKSRFLENMKSGPKNFSDDNLVNKNVVDNLLTKRGNGIKHIIVLKSFAKLGHNINQQLWSMNHLIFVISCVSSNGLIDNNRIYIHVEGRELEKFIITNIHCIKKLYITI